MEVRSTNRQHAEKSQQGHFTPCSVGEIERKDSLQPRSTPQTPRPDCELNPGRAAKDVGSATGRLFHWARSKRVA